MPSSYPGALDASFPGYPYVDNTEYILATYANSWILAIQAIESTVGYGAGASVLNPLYSVPLNETFTTLTARVANIESVTVAAVNIDESVLNVLPVASTAGINASVGKAADSRHQHAGVTSYNGRLGAVTSQVSDFTAAFTTAGQIMVGTGNGTGEALPVGAAGSVLTVGGADPSGLQWATASVAGTFSPGDLKFTTAIVPQTGWLVANAQAVSRSTYANLYAATTIAFTATASGSTISGISSAQTAYMANGMAIEGSGLSGSTITSVSSTSITVSGSPTSGSHNWVVFPNGNGDGSSTFNVIDGRGKSPVGTGGTGSNQSPTYAMGVTGGEQNHTLATGESPVHTHTGETGSEDSTHYHQATTGNELSLHDHNIPLDVTIWNITSTLYANTGQAGGIPIQGQQNQLTAAEGQYHAHGVTTGNEIGSHGHPYTTSSVGSGNAHNNMQPFFVGQWLVKT